jgi:hypothetical protein
VHLGHRLPGLNKLCLATGGCSGCK